MSGGNSSQGSELKKIVRRRKLLQAMSLATATGLAGCSFGGGGGGGNQNDGSGGGGGNDLGERVGTIQMEYWSDRAGITAIAEDISPVIAEYWSELGVETNIEGKALSTQIAESFADERTNHFGIWTHGTAPARLDPTYFTNRYHISNAGRASTTHLANCEISDHISAQGSAPSIEARREEVGKAHQKMGEIVGSAIPIAPRMLFGAARADVVDMADPGKGGMARTSTGYLIESTPKQGNEIVINEPPNPMLQTTNYPITSSSPVTGTWSHLIGSPLVRYNKEFELENVLAEDYQVEDEFKTVTVQIKEGANFHNGDPVTAEDVAFTFQKINVDNVDNYPQSFPMPLDSFDIVDEKTLRFNFTESFPPIISRTFPRWGIMHKDTWVEAGIEDDPENVSFGPGEFVGSGPFEFTEFEENQFLTMSGFPDHVMFSAEHDIVIEGYRDLTSALAALESGDLHVIREGSLSGNERLRNNLSEDQLWTDARSVFTMYGLYPQCQWGPTQYPEFRWAAGQALNRDELNAIGWDGKNEPILYASPLMPAHPYSDTFDHESIMFTEDTSGDIEGARQRLSDAGWGWDNNGNLRYPADYDPSGGQWPQGEGPIPSEYPCLNSDGEYIPKSKR